jgi:predicted DNA-binding protein (MmcQ/YjbR family)
VTPDEIMDACAAYPATELSYPFGEDVAVFKVVGRMFAAVMPVRGHPLLTLKSDPEDARALVATYAEVTPGYHMNKKHWISVALPSTEAPVEELITASYDLVVAKLPRAERPKP